MNGALTKAEMVCVISKEQPLLEINKMAFKVTALTTLTKSIEVWNKNNWEVKVQIALVEWSPPPPPHFKFIQIIWHLIKRIQLAVNNQDFEVVHLLSVLYGDYCATSISFWTLALVLGLGKVTDTLATCDLDEGEG